MHCYSSYIMSCLLFLATRKLSKSVSEGSYDQISQLLGQGANPKASDNKGRTPLHFAAVRGQVDIGMFTTLEELRVF